MTRYFHPQYNHHRKAGGLNEWGEPTTGEEVLYKCRFSERTKIIVNMDGEESVTSTVIYYKDLVDVTYKDKLKYMDLHGNEQIKNIEKIEHKRNLSGKIEFTKVAIK